MGNASVVEDKCNAICAYEEWIKFDMKTYSPMTLND